MGWLLGSAHYRSAVYQAATKPRDRKTAMTDETPPVSPLRNGFLAPALDWQIALQESLMQAQRSQFELLATWQRVFGAVQQDLWDQWKCRFGGGVPLDG